MGAGKAGEKGEEKEPGGGAGHREVLRRPSGEEVEGESRSLPAYYSRVLK